MGKLLIPLLFLAALTAKGWETEFSEEDRIFCDKQRKEFAGNGLLRLLHRDSRCSPFRSTQQDNVYERVAAAAARDRRRYRRHFARGRSVLESDEETLKHDDYSLEFVIELEFGTPGQPFYTIIDTGSDLTWVPCTGCTGCHTDTYFDSSKSSTFSYASCGSTACSVLNSTSKASGCDTEGHCLFNISYVDGSYVEGPVVTDTLEIGQAKFEGFTFGCSQKTEGNSNLTGLVGLGRGRFSLISQTAETYGQVFGHMMPSYNETSATGYFVLGNSSINTTALTYTPLINNSAFPYYYYVDLTGISVAGSRVSLAEGTFDIDERTGYGGVIIDSGTSYTYFPTQAYEAFSSAFAYAATGVAVVPDPTGNFETCFQLTSSDGSYSFPNVTLNLNGLDFPLSLDQTLVQISSNVVCMAFGELPSTDSIGTSLWGNFQQTNAFFLYDVPKGRLGISGAVEGETVTKSSFSRSAGMRLPVSVLFRLLVLLLLCLREVV